METEFNPKYAFHPGVFLKDDLRALGISQKKFSEMTGISTTVINELIKGKRNISTSLALIFEKHLGEPAEFWMNVQSKYDLYVMRNSVSCIEKGFEIEMAPQSSEVVVQVRCSYKAIAA